MERKITAQKLNKKEVSPLDIAYRYYTLLFAVNELNITKREIQLVAFAAIKGNISYATYKEEFCRKFNSSSATIYNMISKLKRKNILIKDTGKVKVNPKILINPDNNFIIQINLNHGETS